jgi:O-antigen ligase
MSSINFKKLFSKQQWGYSSLLLIAATFPLPYKVSNLFIGLAVLVWLLSGNVIKKFQEAFGNPYLWPIFIFFFLHVVALLYTNPENVKGGLFIIEKKLSLIILPIVICSTALSRRQQNNILYCFAWSTVLISLVLISNAAFKYILLGNCNDCFHHGFTSLVGLHAIYFSYYCLFSILILLFYISKKELTKSNSFIFYISIIAIILLFVAIIFAASKTVIISFAILLPIYGITIIPKHKVKLLTVLLLFVFACLATAYSVQPVQERFSNIINDNGFKSLSIVGTSQKLDNNEKRELTGLSLRVLLGKIGLYQIHKDKMYWTGYAPADVRVVLNEVYLSHNMAPNWFYDYNVHNQYIHTYLGLGIVGLLLLLTMLISGLISSNKKKDKLFFFFILLISIAFLTEVVLALNKGIVFYSYFYALFSSKKIYS